MTQDEMLKMLGVKSPKPSSDIQISKAPKKEKEFKPVATNELVLSADKWDKARGVKLSEEQNDPLHSNEWIDFLNACYAGDPQFEEGDCTDNKRQTFMKTMMESSDFIQMRKDTRHNLILAEQAASNLALEYFRCKADMPEDEEEHSDSYCNGSGAAAIAAKVGKAVGQAADKVEQSQEIIRAMMPGGQGYSLQGGPASAVSKEEIFALFQKVYGSHHLKTLLDLCGKYRRVAQSKQRQKTVHGRDDLVGVEASGDIGRLLPSELSLLTDPDLEMLVLQRIIEDRAMCRQFQSVETIGKGPIVVVVDESASMSHNSNHQQAKAFALAMAWIAHSQKRPCVLMGFGVGTPTVCPLDLRRWDLEKLCSWLQHFFDGGTDTQALLQYQIPKMWPDLKMPKGRTDLIIVTDGQCGLSEGCKKAFTEWKVANQVKNVTLIIGEDCGADMMSSVSDETYYLPRLDADADAIGACLSV